MAQPRRLVLASGSRYRKELLGRLGLAFKAVPPQVDESARPGEKPAATALRLAVLKARALQDAHRGALIIGSDQVASLGRRRLGKPGNPRNAVRQLRALSGRAADFHTAVALLDTRTGRIQKTTVFCRVVFRKLGTRQIHAYLRKEKPYDCAGSAKAEGMGIALIKSIETDDPTSLIGLPLIALTAMLARAGLPVV